jgi:hypothetical protein
VTPLGWFFRLSLSVLLVFVGEALLSRAIAAPPEPATAQSGSDLRLIGPPAARAATNETGDQRLLESFDAQNKIRIGVIFAEVNHELDAARGTMGSDPASARQNLRLLLEQILHAPELSADNRAQLRERIEAVIKLADTRLVAKENAIADQQKSAAAAKERTRIEDNVTRGQQRVKQLLERFNSLLQEGRYAEAEDQAAGEALKAAPDSPSAHAAALESRLVSNAGLNAVVRDQGQKQYLAAMHLTDVSAIPFPDEPPIVYPPAEQWRALTKAREKYRTVDMKEPGSAEAKILRALDEPTTMEFIETPLRDVADQLKPLHGIEIQLDTKALAEINITPDTPITKSIKGISLRSALRLMLAEHDMNYIIEDEVLLITTADKAKTTVVTKVYPVADLVLPISINSGLNPFQMGGGLGGNNSNNSGLNGTMSGSSFGRGAFGNANGNGNNNGGLFNVADPHGAL